MLPATFSPLDAPQVQTVLSQSPRLQDEEQKNQIKPRLSLTSDGFPYLLNSCSFFTEKTTESNLRKSCLFL